MAGCGIPQLDELAGAEQGLAAFRVWTRKRAMARDATPAALAEYVQTTTRLLELDQEYWHGIAGANADLVAAQRGRLSPPERQAITERLLARFQAVGQECEERMRPLLARLPEVLQHLEDTYTVAEREDSRSAFLDALVLVAGARGFRVAATEREEEFYVWVLLEPRDAPARLPGERPELAPPVTREDLQRRAAA